MRLSYLIKSLMASALLVLSLGLQVSATEALDPQKTYDLSLSMTAPTVNQFTEAVTQKIGVLFSFDASISTEKMSDVKIDVKGQTLESIMQTIFASQSTGLSYKVMFDKVMIYKEDAPAQTNQSDGKIRGVVKDDMGPLMGAGIMVKGTSRGVVSDLDGNYEIEAAPGEVLIFTSLGYADQEVTVGASSVINVDMATDVNLLEEVVVVGYGTQKKSSLSGAVGIIDGTKLNSRPVVSAANALQGADPSVNISFATGSPEASSDINIRGSISLNGGSPLVLADGVEVDLKQINPNDIESVSVLKDASTCAIYGAKASAGVVLITTKQGKKGDIARVQYNGRVGWAQNTTSTDFIRTGYDHVQIVNQFMNDSSDATKDILRYTESNGGLQKLYDRRNDLTENPDRPWVEVGDDGKYYYYGNYDWYGYFYNRVRPQHEHNLSVSGSSDKISYYASGRFLQQKGMFNVAEDDYKDYSFRAKFSANIKKWLKYSTNVNFSNSNFSYGGHPDYEQTIRSLQANISPAFVPVNPDGSVVQYVNQLGKNSPLGSGRAGQMTAGKSHNSKISRYLTISNQFDITLCKGLVLTAAYDYRQADKLNKYRNNTFEYSREQGKFESFHSGSVKNSYREIHSFNRGHNLNIYGTYQNTFAKHHYFKIVVGGQYETYRYRKLDAEQLDLTSDNIDSFSVGKGVITLGQDIKASKTLGFFTRANYDFKGKYIVEASFRADGSSRFESKNRWGFFPSASLAWRLSEENFFAPARDVMNNFKIRASVGSLGNQQVDYYQYIQDISTDNVLDYTFDGISNAFYSKVSDPLSSGLTWETVTTYDVGLDMGFFNNRLTFVGDFYVRDTKNMLTKSLTLPDTFGAPTPKANCANLRTTGFEISLGWNDSFQALGKPFSYNVSATLGDYVSTITKYHNPDGLFTGNNFYEGMRLGDIWGYRVEGLFKTDREAAEYQAKIDDRAVNSRLYQGKGPAGNYLRAGDVKFKDLDGNGRIDQGSGTINDPGDMEIIGNSLPRFSYSLRLGFSWMGFDISTFFQGVGRRNWYPSAGQNSYDFWGPYAFPPTAFIHTGFADNCWSEDNRNAYFPRPRGYNAYSGGALGTVNDRYLQNIAYFRFKNLTVGYTLPEKLTKKAGIEMVRFYFTGENLCYASPMKKYNKTVDPELAGKSGNSNKSGTGYAYPMTLSIGLDIQF